MAGTLAGAAVAALALVGATLAPLGSAGAAEPAVPDFDHVITIVLENYSFDQAFGPTGASQAPYLNELADDWALSTQSYGVSHHSLTDYIGLVSGQGPTPKTRSNCWYYDCLYPASVATVADQIEASGRDWRGYVEGMPAPCTRPTPGVLNPYRLYNVPAGNRYISAVNPWIYFAGIADDAARCAQHVVPFERLDTDLAAGALPDYALITPDLCNSGHDCPLATADAWLAQVVPDILADPGFQAGGVLFITFDEAPAWDTSGCCGNSNGGHIGTVVISPTYGATNGYRWHEPVSLYSQLATVEDAWGLGRLGHAGDPGVVSFAPVFDPALRLPLVPSRGSASVAGTVTRPGGAPLAGAIVQVADAATGELLASASAAADGTWQAGGLSRGRVKVFATDPSGRWALRYHGDTPTSAGALPVDLEARTEITGIDVALPPGQVLRGRITSGGVPQAGVAVLAVDPSPVALVGMATTGPAGVYALEGLAPGSYAVLAVDPRVLLGSPPYLRPEAYPDVDILGTPDWMTALQLVGVTAGTNQAGVDLDLVVEPGP